MTSRLLVSDANIFIDMAKGDLLKLMFELDVVFAVPNTLYEEELIDDHPDLPGLGLQSIELLADGVIHAEKLVQKYQSTGVSINDLLALAVAHQEKCPLLTGDAKLRSASEGEDIEVHGTLWVVAQLLEAGLLNAEQARDAYQRMRQAGRRLPWKEVEDQLRKFN